MSKRRLLGVNVKMLTKCMIQKFSLFHITGCRLVLDIEQLYDLSFSTLSDLKILGYICDSESEKKFCLLAPS